MYILIKCFIFNYLLAYSYTYLEKVQEECPEQCLCSSSAVNCEYIIPKQLPNYTQSVTLNGIHLGKLPSDVFTDGSWPNVKILRILPDVYLNGTLLTENEWIIIRGNMFLSLNSLKHLKISSRRLRTIKKGAFNGLHNLEILDLSDNVELALANVITGLQSKDMKLLHTLNLKKLSMLSASRGAMYGSSFFETLKHQKIRVLDLSYNEGSTLDPRSLSVNLPFLTELNLESSGYMTSAFMAAGRYFPHGLTFKNLKRINLNYGILPLRFMDAQVNKNLGQPPIQNLTELKVRGLTPLGTSSKLYCVVNETFITLRIVFGDLNVTWHLFAFELVKYDLLDTISYTVALEVLDLSFNGFEHLDDSFSRFWKHVWHLNLSNNKLFQMATPELERLLYNTSALEVFNCSYNQLEIIPKTTFRFTKNIKVIDVAHNSLKAITFEIEHLEKLMYLDISHNRFKTLDEISIGRINALIYIIIEDMTPHEHNITNSSTISIDISGNPFECTCGSIKFVEWMITAQERSVLSKAEMLTCKLNGEQRTFDGVIEDVEYLCKLPIIIAVSTVISGICVIIITVVIICLYLRSKRIKHKQRLIYFINKYKSTINKEKVPVFLSYCSGDSEFVGQKVIPPLNEKLQTIFDSAEMCISTGDLNFSPGAYVAEEIVKCIESCSVVIACVSRQFCNSHWCKDEIITAKTDNKPIILMFLEPVVLKEMPKVIRKQYQLTTRCKWEMDAEGEYTLTPDWDTVCGAIVELIQAQTQL